jgi:hypothetical protein
MQTNAALIADPCSAASRSVQLKGAIVQEEIKRQAADKYRPEMCSIGTSPYLSKVALIPNL